MTKEFHCDEALDVDGIFIHFVSGKHPPAKNTHLEKGLEKVLLCFLNRSVVVVTSVLHQ